MFGKNNTIRFKKLYFWFLRLYNEAQQTQTLQHQIAATDQQINQAVEVLYGLSNTKPEV